MCPEIEYICISGIGQTKKQQTNERADTARHPSVHLSIPESPAAPRCQEGLCSMRASQMSASTLTDMVAAPSSGYGGCSSSAGARAYGRRASRRALEDSCCCCCCCCSATASSRYCSPRLSMRGRRYDGGSSRRSQSQQVFSRLGVVVVGGVDMVPVFDGS